eukprot:COSAG06_NODE_29924_length_548_cov_0.837416_2_plen_26_part_01
MAQKDRFLTLWTFAACTMWSLAEVPC